MHTNAISQATHWLQRLTTYRFILNFIVAMAAICLRYWISSICIVRVSKSTLSPIWTIAPQLGYCSIENDPSFVLQKIMQDFRVKFVENSTGSREALWDKHLSLNVSRRVSVYC